jgi:hypothetical protein
MQENALLGSKSGGGKEKEKKLGEIWEKFKGECIVVLSIHLLPPLPVRFIGPIDRMLLYPCIRRIS